MITVVGLVEPSRLRERIRMWAEEEIRAETLLPQAGRVLEAVLYRGEVPRGDVPEIVGTGDRQARRIVASLLKAGVFQSESTRTPLRIAFPATWQADGCRGCSLKRRLARRSG